MLVLTDKQSEQINNAKYTHNYEAEALCFNTYEDINDIFTERFETETGFTKGSDLGGLIVYFKDNVLVAFYDYERFVGTVF